MANAFIPLFFKFSTWSFIKAIKGLITKQMPSLANVGT